jgi:hypothetical protein
MRQMKRSDRTGTKTSWKMSGRRELEVRSCMAWLITVTTTPLADRRKRDRISSIGPPEFEVPFDPSPIDLFDDIDIIPPVNPTTSSPVPDDMDVMDDLPPLVQDG